VVRVIHTDEQWLIADLGRRVLGLTVKKEFGRETSNVF
jgi:hypothetical protein